ncbi:MAG: hypothetical protein FWB96_08585 [Defluviitaleaceae bacterium]|nr:hypothetical protein [Defluviitaleaceae bacterium]MCL2262826.1 hypothetical protein [Defluviitaleaceae bacterium]
MEQKRIQKAENLAGVRNAFEPEPLDGEDLNEFYCDCTMESRVGNKRVSPLEDLFELCSRPSAQNAHLLLGHRGCGKSTELNKLKIRFQGEGQPVAVIDCQKEMDVFRGNHWDLMLLITDGLCRIARENNIKLPEATEKAIYDFLLKEQIIESEQERAADLGTDFNLSAGLPVIGGIFGAIARVTGSMKYNEYTRTKVTETMQKRVSEWVAYTNVIADCIKSGSDMKEPVLIFEALDKFGMASEPGKIFEIFRYSPLASMSFPIIYTFPISQLYSTQFADLGGLYNHHTLPMIKVINKDGSRYQAGIESIRKIVALRIADGFNLFSDEKDENGDDVLTVLIIKTGGLLRHLFECIATAATLSKRGDKTQIEMEDAELALRKIKDDLTRRLHGDDYRKLTEIYNNEKLREERNDKPFMLQMLQAITIVEYSNGKHWHDVHPLVAEFLADLGMVTLRVKK